MTMTAMRRSTIDGKKVGNAGTSRSSREVFAPRNMESSRTSILFPKILKGVETPYKFFYP